jgi:hypothetical protein
MRIAHFFGGGSVMNPIKVKYFEIILKNVPLHLEDHLRKK